MFYNPERKYIFYLFISMAFLVLGARLFYLQIIKTQKYTTQSERNRIRRIVLEPVRGLIYDRNGQVLVENRPSYSISAIPYECLSNDSTLVLLAQILNKPKEVIVEKLKAADYPLSSVKIERDVSLEQLGMVEERALELPGVMHDVGVERMYPGGITSAHLFGYLGEISKSELDVRRKDGLEPGNLVGKKGLEKQYDTVLRGKSGYNYVEVNASGREVKDVVLDIETAPYPGNDIYLTIDVRLQKLAEELFAEKSGGIVLLDAINGGVLVMCSKPDYDPVIFSGILSSEKWRQLVNDERRPLFDRIVQSEYPPGSTFKMVTAAAVIQENLIDVENEHVFCDGYYKLGRRAYKCWNQDGHGSVDLLEALQVSCNVFFYKQSLKLDADVWADYAKRFLFGKSTGIDLPGESKGLVPGRAYLNKTYGENKWTKGTMLNLGIGQGDLLVTPLQMAQYAMIIANNGVFFKPHLLMKQYDPVKKAFDFYEPQFIQIDSIADSVFEILRQGMFRVVNAEHGTGRASALSNVKVAGKTGTAQNPHGDPHAWFVGFAPYNAPQVAICVFIENGGGGGAQAAPIAKKILEKYFNQEGF